MGSLGASSCVLVALAARHFFDRRVGLVAGIMLAFYGPAIFFDGLVQKSSLDLLLVTAVLALLAEFDARGGARWLVAAGIALGLLTLNRENARILYPVICGWLVLRGGERVRHAALFTAAVLLVLVPVGLRGGAARA